MYSQTSLNTRKRKVIEYVINQYKKMKFMYDGSDITQADPGFSFTVLP